MISKAIKRAFEKARKKKWDRIYIFVDVHETIVVPNYNVDKIPTEFYPKAKETLQFLSNRQDIVLAMYTCSWPQEIAEYRQFFRKNGIEFSYANKNPEVKTIPKKYGYYIDKPYADVLLDDKAGFDWETDWSIVHECILEEPLLCEVSQKEDLQMFDMERAAEWFKAQKNDS